MDQRLRTGVLRALLHSWCRSVVRRYRTGQKEGTTDEDRTVTTGVAPAVSSVLGLRSRIRITAVLVFETAWRIGSGREGETMSDLGVVRDHDGQPVLPGSSLKGRLRSTCEALAHALGMNACMLNQKASGVECASDSTFYDEKVRQEYREASREGLESRRQWINAHTCDVCKLFGSPIRTGHLRVSDGALREWAEVVQVRDGVVIDRDSHTAVKRLKYDYEVVPPGSRFGLCVDLENADDRNLALLGAALFEWCAGSSIGGFTSRGLGRFHLEEIELGGVDLNDPAQRVRFLTATRADQRLVDLGDWESYFAECINRHRRSKTPAADSEEG